MTKATMTLAAAAVAAAAWAKSWVDPTRPGEASAVTKLARGGELRVDAIAHDLFRVRMKRGEAWTESGMNRYGVVPRSLGEVKDVVRAAGGFRTKSAEVSVDEATGVVRLKSLVSAADLTIAPKLVGKGYEVKFPLAKGERLYGLGDASRENVQRRPGRYEIWVKNMVEYIPVPMMVSRRGWGVFMNTTWRNWFDVGVKDPDALMCEAPESELDFYVFVGKDYPALLEAYTRLTGRPALLPIWGYGFTYVANMGVDRYFLMGEAREFRREKLPCDVIGLEPGWMEKNYDMSTRKEWHLERFGRDMKLGATGDYTWAAALRRSGFKLSLWLCCNYDLFRYEEQCAAGQARKMGFKPDLPPEVTEAWEDDRIATGKAGDELTGFGTGKNKPKFGELEKNYKEGDLPWFMHLRKFVDQGARGFKLDGSCQVTEWNGVPNRKWANGMDNEEAHNLYPLVYDKQMAEGYEEYTRKRPMVYSAGGYAGVQKYVATWAGDTGGGAKPLVSVLNLGVSGHSNQSCDMHIQTPASLHFGFLSPWSEHNNWGAWRQAWYQDDDKLDEFRHYLRLRYRLLPYLYAAAARAARTGWPMMRPLAFDWPDESVYDSCLTTYMLGSHLLVSAFAKETVVPAGVWHEFYTGRRIVGPRKEPFAVRHKRGGGLYVRGGAIIPECPDYVPHVERGWSRRVEFHVWPSADGEGELYEDDGENLDYRAGKYSIVPLAVKKTETGCTFTVGRRHGTDRGTYVPPMDRPFSAVFHLDAPPKSAEVDGKPAMGEWNADELTYAVPLGAIPVPGRVVKLAL